MRRVAVNLTSREAALVIKACHVLLALDDIKACLSIAECLTLDSIEYKIKGANKP